MSSKTALLKEGSLNGVKKGWSGFVWMIKILLPISFMTALLQWSGWLQYLDFLIQPLMHWLSLPAAAALPLLIGMLTNIYGGIAAMMVLPLTKAHMTLIAIFLLIAHNLIQEGVIQGKSGLHPLKATVFRLVVATLTVLLVAPFLDTSAQVPAEPGAAFAGSQPFGEMLLSWCAASFHLSLKIFGIIMSLMIVLESLKALGWIDAIVKVFTPLLRILGLSPKVGILWSTAAVFGLAYGAAVIVEEARRGDLSREELESLQLSIGINHSMVEDPALFLSLGLSAFWLYIPRFLMAMCAVRLLTLWQTLRKTQDLKSNQTA